MNFPHLRSKVEYLLAHPEYCKTKDGLIDLICRDCEFWKEDEKDYECGAFKLLSFLLQKETISVEEIMRAISE